MRAAGLIVFVFLTLAVTGGISRSSEPKEQNSRRLEVLEAQYQELKDDVFAKRMELNQHYQAELNQIMNRAEAGSAAEIAQAARAELETFRTWGRPGKTSHIEPIARLQGIFTKQIQSIGSSELNQFAALVKSYRQKLEAFRAEMINEGEVELVFQTYKATQRLDSDIAQMKANAGGDRFYIPGTQPVNPAGTNTGHRPKGIWE